MRYRRVLYIIVAFLMVAGLFCIPAYAAQSGVTPPTNNANIFAISRATESFNITIPAKTKLSAGTSFPLVVGETVTINASYAPFSASVDFGLITPSGTFRYFRITNGSINKTILIEESGNYIFQIRNNSNYEIQVTGFVNY